MCDFSIEKSCKEKGEVHLVLHGLNNHELREMKSGGGTIGEEINWVINLRLGFNDLFILITHFYLVN